VDLAIAAVAAVVIVGAIGVHILRRNGVKSIGTAKPEAERFLAIAKSPEELYEHCKDPVVVQRINGHLVPVDALDHQHAGWSAWTRLARWRMRLVEDRVDGLVRWQPEEPAPLRESSVCFLFRRMAGRAPL
jgi:hypothetical protein